MSELRVPFGSEQYHPDTDEPMDRWFQAANASNVRTIIDIVKHVVPSAPAFVVDPFVGGGSTVAASRILRLPCYGIELDPVLTCVSVAKAHAREQHGKLLEALLAEHDRRSVAGLLRDIGVRCTPADRPMVSALAVLAGLRAEKGARLGANELSGDLARSEMPASASRIVCGDGTDSTGWAALALPDADVVLYTSPPFGQLSPALDASVNLRRAAQGVLKETGAYSLDRIYSPFSTYLDTTLRMLRHALERLRRATVVIEHEPADDGLDSADALIEQVQAEFRPRIHRPRIEVCGEFSWRGPLSLIVFDLR